ncbi:MAG: SH3 domain-containing protein [Streptococcaceae bacterium]|nr:SH3 domain-containing protein [Streptococcaceae bacterium]
MTATDIPALTSLLEDPQTNYTQAIFGALSTANFDFSSGAGAWATDLKINSDGTFSGEWHDADQAGPIMSVSDFTGKFINPRQVTPESYAFDIQYLNYSKDKVVTKKDVGDGKTQVITTGYPPYGFAQQQDNSGNVEVAKSVILYLTGTEAHDINGGKQLNFNDYWWSGYRASFQNNANNSVKTYLPGVMIVPVFEKIATANPAFISTQPIVALEESKLKADDPLKELSGSIWRYSDASIDSRNEKYYFWNASGELMELYKTIQDSGAQRISVGKEEEEYSDSTGTPYKWLDKNTLLITENFNYPMAFPIFHVVGVGGAVGPGIKGVGETQCTLYFNDSHTSATVEQKGRTKVTDVDSSLAGNYTSSTPIGQWSEWYTDKDNITLTRLSSAFDQAENTGASNMNGSYYINLGSSAAVAFTINGNQITLNGKTYTLTITENGSGYSSGSFTIGDTIYTFIFMNGYFAYSSGSSFSYGLSSSYYDIKANKSYTSGALDGDYYYGSTSYSQSFSISGNTLTMAGTTYTIDFDNGIFYDSGKKHVYIFIYTNGYFWFQQKGSETYGFGLNAQAFPQVKSFVSNTGTSSSSSGTTASAQPTNTTTYSVTFHGDPATPLLYLNVRQEPNTDSAIIGKLYQNDIVYVSEIKDGWATVQYNGKTAHLSMDYLELKK